MNYIGGKRAIALCILEILNQYSDYDHPLKLGEIAGRLESHYGIIAERKAISRNIALLCEMGYDISTFTENRRGYYMVERGVFDDLELRLMIDSVMTSKYIPVSDASRMIEKLKNLSNIYFAAKMEHVTQIEKWPHQRNKQFFINLDLIDSAITDRVKITFIYNKYEVDGQLHPIKNEKYVACPYRIICANAQYYLVAKNEEHGALRHYRIDKMTELSVLNDKVEISDLDPVEYAMTHIYMYGGEKEHILLRMDIDRVGDVLETFGSGTKMTKIDDQTVMVEILAAAQGIRYFALQYGPSCEVIKPEHLRSTIKNDLDEMIKKYN